MSCLTVEKDEQSTLVFSECLHMSYTNSCPVLQTRSGPAHPVTKWHPWLQLKTGNRSMNIGHNYQSLSIRPCDNRDGNPSASQCPRLVCTFKRSTKSIARLIHEVYGNFQSPWFLDLAFVTLVLFGDCWWGVHYVPWTDCSKFFTFVHLNSFFISAVLVVRNWQFQRKCWIGGLFLCMCARVSSC